MPHLRILHVVPYYEQAWAYGGIPRLATTLTRALARRGHHVTVCTTDVRDDRTRLLPTGSGETPRANPGLDVHVFPNVSNRLAYHWQLFTPRGLSRFLEQECRRGAFDVAHVHACHNLPGSIAARILTRSGIPYVVAPNGTGLPIERRIVAKRIFAATAGRHVLPNAAAVLAVSEAERRQLATLVDPTRLCVVPNPIDDEEFAEPPDGDRFRRAHGFGARPIVLFLGKLTPRKGADVLVRAFERLPHDSARLVIAGNDMGAGRALQTLVRSRQLESRVLRLGLLTGRARLDALAAADVVVYPSRDEVFGLVPIEALLSGSPVVVADDSGCGEIVAEIGGGCSVPYGDAGALAAALRSVLDSPEVWRDRVVAAAARARMRFGTEPVCDRLEQVYFDAAPSRRTSRAAAPVGVSFVVPVLNGRRTIRTALDGIARQQDGRPFEILAVDDGSTDGSLRVMREWARGATPLRILHGPGRGAAAAVNLGFREASHPIVCQVDQDVILAPGWLPPLLGALDDPEIAAAQGHYLTADGAGFWARAMGRDLEHRYASIKGRLVDHVCTGNTAYRASALHQVGLLDETLGYGYDNDLSYRLLARGHRLAFCRESTSVHRWPEGLRGYLRQQFGVGYGRIDVVLRHPRRVAGDAVSGPAMMLHGPLMLAAVGAMLMGLLAAVPRAGAVGAVVVAALAVERLLAGVRARVRTGDPAALGFAVAHLVRDLAWAAAIVVWVARRLRRVEAVPAHSMTGRQRGARRAAFASTQALPAAPRLMAIIPAFNEAETLPRVVAELKARAPAFDRLIVNDGSTDSTAALLSEIDARSLTLSHRVGVGGAVRTGIRFALRERYDFAVRVDADFQHRACDIARLLQPVACGQADVAIGSRFVGRRRRGGGVRRAGQAALAACLTLLTGRRVTDPTSGFWLFGPRALRLLADHHPTGYAEPELALLLQRNGLRVVEVPIRMRPRRGGRTSLTATRTALALARTLLAIVVVPLRRVVEGSAGD